MVLKRLYPSTIRIGYPKSFPSVSSSCRRFPELKATPRCVLPGQIVEILKLLTEELDITIEAFPLQNDQVRLLFNPLVRVIVKLEHIRRPRKD
jgi:hypothetical protein